MEETTFVSLYTEATGAAAPSQPREGMNEVKLAGSLLGNALAECLEKSAE